MTINAVYPETKTLLCLWHVLCTIRSHFVTEKFLVLQLLQDPLELVKITLMLAGV